MGAIAAIATATAATKAITAITAASPPVVTSNAHGYTNGQIVYLDAIVGMTQLNKRAFVVANVTANTYELKGIDGTAYTAYVSGGTAALKTMTAIGEVRAVNQLFDGEANEIDVSHLGSAGEEFLMGIPRFGNNSLTVLCPSPNDTGQTRLRALQALQTAETFTVTLASGQVAVAMVLVKSFQVGEIGVDGAVMATVGLRNAAAPAFFA
jgi:hypothetical protein